MIVVNNIDFNIKSKALLTDVSVNFEPGKFNLIIGPNGAGKSTLIKIISGQITPNKGTVLYDVKDLKQITKLEAAKIRAVLSQNNDIAFPLKVNEVVMMGRYPHFALKPSQKDLDACQAAMAYFNIEDMANREYLTLSGGEKQRVNFARVMAQIWFSTPNQMRYLILDEPLTFLDIQYQYQFMEKVKDLLIQKDIVVVGVIHDLNLVAKYADYILFLNDGKVLAQGKKQAVLTANHIYTAFNLKPNINIDGDNLTLSF